MKIIRVLLLLCCFMAETMLAQNVTIKGHIGDFSGKLKLTVRTGELRSSHEFCSFYINTPDFEVSFESPTNVNDNGKVYQKIIQKYTIRKSGAKVQKVC